jgi:Putative peptidoglycan binding domain/L,D-transpeptidase catalytic domain
MAFAGNPRRVAGLLAMALVVPVALAACGSAHAEGDGGAAGRSSAGQSSSAAPAKPAAPSSTAAASGGSKAGGSRTAGGASAGGKSGERTKATKPAPPPQLRLGDHGAAVLALQRRLAALGYEVTKPDGEFGSETHHAVIAFQKVNRLDRDGVAGPKTLKALEDPRRPQPRSRGGGLLIEADLTLQVVYVVENGKVEQILDASSGSGAQYVVDGDMRIAHTPEGSFHVERKINAWHRSPLGLLYRPAYFVGGYALHGAPNVPPFPASHGCIRITTTAMDRLYDRLALGTPLLVYRS